LGVEPVWRFEGAREVALIREAGLEGDVAERVR